MRGAAGWFSFPEFSRRSYANGREIRFDLGKIILAPLFKITGMAIAHE